MIATILLIFLVVALGAAFNIFVLAWGLTRIGCSSEKHSSDVKKRS